MSDDEAFTHHITVAGTLSARFARGCGCAIAAGAEPGTTTLALHDPRGVRLGAVLRGLENLGVEVRGVDPVRGDPRAGRTGGNRE
jgi:hypothetical protein